jgi:hypothetical protein
MKIRQVNYDDAERPERATFEVTIREMAYLVRLLGDQSGNSMEATMRGSSDVDCYSPLATLFNSHWDNGVDDYLQAQS